MDQTTGEIQFTVFKGSPDRRIVQATNHRPKLSGDQVLLRITHSSLCGTDEHFLEKDMCLGHEGAGIVEALGPEAHTLRVGQNVAFGYQRGACGECAQCLGSLEIFCPQRAFYGFSEPDIGSMASHIVFRESFTYALPPSISNEQAAALMCGGATVFNVFDMFAVKPTDCVGVVGMGGLGHLAVQFASKWGCKVVVFSSSEAKRQAALDYGAHEFYATSGVTKLEGVPPIDHLLVTTSFQIPWAMYIDVMNKPGTIYPLTVSFDELTVPYIPFLFGGIRLQASIVAPRVIYKRMLAFAALHGIAAAVERYKLDVEGVEGAMADLRLGKMKYKGVLCAA